MRSMTDDTGFTKLVSLLKLSGLCRCACNCTYTESIGFVVRLLLSVDSVDVVVSRLLFNNLSRLLMWLLCNGDIDWSWCRLLLRLLLAPKRERKKKSCVYVVVVISWNIHIRHLPVTAAMNRRLAQMMIRIRWRWRQIRRLQTISSHVQLTRRCNQMIDFSR